MPSNIQQVSFTNPLDPAGSAALAVQQQDIQRRMALAQQLQQQSAQELRAQPGSTLSWTQGAAKLAQALAAKHIINKANNQQIDLATKQGQAMARMFGIGQDNAPQDRGAFGSGGVEDNGNLPQSPAVSGQSTNAPMSLSGNPVQDYTDYSLNPEEYTKALISSHAPVDMSKIMSQAKAAMDRGDVATASALLNNVQKQNYIAPVTGRPGAIQRDPITNKIIGVDPQNIEGANPEIVNGEFTGRYTPAPGAAGVVQQVSAAKAVGSASGDLVDVYNPSTQQMVKVPKAALLSGAANGQSPMAAGAPLGAEAAANVTGKNSANGFTDISNGAADVPNRIYALKQMQSLANDPKSQFGAGSEGLNHFNSMLGTISQSTGISFDPKAATNSNEFQKWATQYSARSGQELGLSGSDARTQLAVHATPNGEMTRQALQSVIPQMIGIENAKQGYAQAANVWQRMHGAQSLQEFRTAWNKVYDPSIYTHMAQGPQAFAGWVKTLDARQAAQVRDKYMQLKSIGALPQ